MTINQRLFWTTATLVALAAMLCGCAYTEAGHFKTKRLLATLDVSEAEVESYDVDSTGRTNHFEHWHIQGLKSDTTRALQTVEKVADTLKALALSGKTNVTPVKVNAPVAQPARLQLTSE